MSQITSWSVQHEDYNLSMNNNTSVKLLTRVSVRLKTNVCAIIWCPSEDTTSSRCCFLC